MNYIRNSKQEPTQEQYALARLNPQSKPAYSRIPFVNTSECMELRKELTKAKAIPVEMYLGYTSEFNTDINQDIDKLYCDICKTTKSVLNRLNLSQEDKMLDIVRECVTTPLRVFSKRDVVSAIEQKIVDAKASHDAVQDRLYNQCKADAKTLVDELQARLEIATTNLKLYGDEYV